MRFLALILLFSFAILFKLQAQVKQTIYYDSLMNKTKSEAAARFTEVIERESKKADGGTIKRYKLPTEPGSSPVLLSEGYYSDIAEPRKAHGELITYYESGQKESSCTYVNGRQEGTCTKWFENGQLYFSIAYKNGLYHGALKSYFATGAPKRDDRYEEGKPVQQKCFDENGNEIAYFPFAQMPAFFGGEREQLRFIAANLRYPAEAMRLGKSGLVVVQVTIDAKGNPKNYTFAKRIYPPLDQEALRVVKAMPKWVPGTIEGLAEETVAYVPVKFSIR